MRKLVDVVRVGMNSTSRKKIIQEYYARRSKDYDRQKSRTWKSTKGFSNEIGDALLSALSDFEKKTVLEVGCGSGRNAAPLVEKTGARMVGLDLCKEMLMVAMAKMRLLPADFDLVLGDADHLPFADEALDAVVCMSTMHYFDSPDEIVEDFSKVLKPQSVLIYGDLSVHENDDTGFFEGLERTLSEAHARYNKPSEMKRMLEKNGFHVSAIITFAYRKSYDALMEDKGRYFHVSRQTLDTYLHKAEPVEKELYALSESDLTLFYTVVEAQKRK